MKQIECTLYRAGTSKVLFFLKDLLPNDENERDNLILNIMGSNDHSQVNGLGGGTSLSSKVGIISRSEREGIDVDFLFLQVGIGNTHIGKKLNCGNAISAVASFAIENNLVSVNPDDTSKTVTVYNENTGQVVLVTVDIKCGVITYEGTTEICGVNGTGSPILVTFLNHSKRSDLLPTGEAVDIIEGVKVSCVNYITPMVIINATSLGLSGQESIEDLGGNTELLAQLKKIRETAGLRMGMGDVSSSVSPKLCVVSEPVSGGDIKSCYFTPFEPHRAHAVSGALCLCASMHIEGSITYHSQHNGEIRIEHPSGFIDVAIDYSIIDNEINIYKGSNIRTARPLIKGFALMNQPHLYIKNKALSQSLVTS